MIDRYSRPEMKKIWSDENKYNKWLKVELAACEAWTQLGEIPEEDMAKLRVATYNMDRLNEILNVTKHDMTAFLKSITESIGPEGRWIHKGLTTSDVWDTATSLQLLEASNLLSKEIDKMLNILKTKAVEYKSTIMMGRTHGVHAEPITFGLKLALWWDEMRRNKERLESSVESISYGKLSGPVGTFATVPPKVEDKVCTYLGLKPAPVSNQVLQRDNHAEFITTLALIASSLEKFATEIRGLQRTEIREVEEPFGKGQTGSSSMPHKRNPELSERICGLARLIRGHALTSLENVALWGERDISHSSAERIIFPDTCLALDYMISIFIRILEGMTVYSERMESNLKSGKSVFFSQKLMLNLVDSGMSREKAYKIVQTLALKSVDENVDFQDLVRTNTDVTKVLSSSDINKLFDHKQYLVHLDEIFDRLGF
ncbi:MAG: adenylosuccinate lyase [SAR202 cluster bacterium]|nr:adenylosuccinate lyase [SAR202 cluster bacterium]|tara:strand:+ start:26 stop:1315 length:1290 start_codon:yes stop_codon:yes gene_type:complete